MTDEEKKAIESLIEIREFANLSSYKDIKINQLNAIDTILNLIEKQSKEIEELKDKCKELIFEKQELTSALLDSTPDDKIKAKIEELNNPESELFKSLFNINEPTWSVTIQRVLQSLLEKE